MNSSPINFLISIAIGGILWVTTAIFIGPSFSESLLLAMSTPEEFSSNLRIIFGIAAAIGILICIYWLYYGNLKSTAGNLPKAKKVYITLFILQVIASVSLFFALIFMNLKEGLLTTNWLVIFGLLSLLTWFYFWIITFLFSPRSVKYIPFFK